MTATKQFAIAFVSLFLASVITIAQDARTLDTKVADILAMMPLRNEAQLNRAMDELVKLGDKGFSKIASQITPSGKNDNIAAKYAINSLARYANQYGTEKKRDFTERNLVKALTNAKNSEVKAFFMTQLNLVGSDAAVEAVKSYLADEELYEHAAMVLRSAGNTKAIEAFTEILPNAGNNIKLTIVQNLGELKASGANGLIIEMAETGDSDLKRASLKALAAIGAPTSYNTIFSAAKDAKFGYEPSNAIASFLSYAKSLGENGHDKLCKKACDTIIKNSKSGSQLHNRASAYSILVKLYGHEIVPKLLKEFENPDKAFRNAILNISEHTGDIADTRKWIKKAVESEPGQRAEIIGMLGRRGDPFAIPWITNEIYNSNAPQVIKASINALILLDKKAALTVVAGYLTRGEGEIEYAEKALLTLIDRKHLNLIAKKMDTAPENAKVAIINIIGAKSGKNYFREVLNHTYSESKVIKDAAYRALKNVSSGSDMDKLLNLLYATSGEDYEEDVRQAIISAALDIKDNNTRSDRLLSLMKSSSQKEKVIGVLPYIGGAEVLEAVTKLFNSGDRKVKDAAFNALTNWKGYSASESLYNICNEDESSYRAKAFSSFVSQTSTSNLTDDQKLLQLRKIMPLAKSMEEKKSVIIAAGRVKTFLSLVFVSGYLDTPELQSSAANSAMKIALPSGGMNNGMSGDIVKEILNNSTDKLSGGDAQYDREKIIKYLSEMPKGKGMASMFNGKDLTGWKGFITDPVNLAKMSPEDRAAKQKEADIKLHENWSVKNGSIVFNGNGDNLLSAKEYGNFELIVDWKITKKGDSGIYLRGTPQVQIWDTSRIEVGAQVGSGGLYNNLKNPSKPLEIADNPIGDWNTFHITMIEDKVTVYLNGKLVVDNVTLENYWNRDMPIFPKGTIELQAHGTDLAFRDIYVREIESSEYKLTEEEEQEGFVVLFNGKNLDGWQGNKADYIARNGELLVRPGKSSKGGSTVNLFTEKEYSDFIFRFEFKLTPGANNGLGIRCPLEGDGAYEGIELQILDNGAPIYANLEPYQYHGSAYGIIPSRRGFLKSPGEWNYQEVIARGSHIKVTLNGTVILDGDVAKASENGTLDKKDHPGLKRAKGYIGFLGHGSELEFRNIRLKEL